MYSTNLICKYIHTRRLEKFNTLNQTQFSFSGYLGTPVQFIFHTCRSSLLVQQQKLDRGHIYSLIFTPSPGLLLLVYLSGFTLQTTTYLTLLSLKPRTFAFLLLQCLAIVLQYDGKSTLCFYFNQSQCSPELSTAKLYYDSLKDKHNVPIFVALSYDGRCFKFQSLRS